MAIAAMAARPISSSTKLLTRQRPKWVFIPLASSCSSSSSPPPPPKTRTLVLYSKPGCCLCDGLKEKLQAAFLLSGPNSLHDVVLQVRDITTNPDWERAYQYEIPVLAKVLADGTELYTRLAATVDSENFMERLKSLQQVSANKTCIEFPFKEATEHDIHSAEVLINVSHDEPSWWVWVSEEMVPNNVEERSGIDDENYVVVTEEHVVEGVAYFMAKCILSNPNSQNLTPEELQKILAKALEGVSKWEKVLDIWHAGQLFYTLATWGLALWGLYRSRAVLKLAAKGVHATSKAVLKAL